jgi:hypothetical protein
MRPSLRLGGMMETALHWTKRSGKTDAGRELVLVLARVILLCLYDWEGYCEEEDARCSHNAQQLLPYALVAPSRQRWEECGYQNMGRRSEPRRPPAWDPGGFLSEEKVFPMEE